MNLEGFGGFGGKKTKKQKNVLHERGFSKLKASRAKNSYFNEKHKTN